MPFTVVDTAVHHDHDYPSRAAYVKLDIRPCRMAPPSSVLEIEQIPDQPPMHILARLFQAVGIAAALVAGLSSTKISIATAREATTIRCIAFSK